MRIVPPVAGSSLGFSFWSALTSHMRTSLPGVTEGLGPEECPAPLSCL